MTRVEVHAHMDPYDEDSLPSASAKLFNRTQTLIVEAIDQRTYPHFSMNIMLDKGLIREDMLHLSLPCVRREDEGLTIVHSIVPFEPRKRVRDD